MRKKALSLAMALALCLGLTIPTFAAEATVFENEELKLTNVIEHVTSDAEMGGTAFTCIAPVEVTLIPYKHGVTELIHGKVLADSNISTADAAKQVYNLRFEEIATPESLSVTLTEPGIYMVEYDLRPGPDNEELPDDEQLPELSFTRYIVIVQPGSETAPSVPTTDPTTTTPQTASPTNDALTADGVLQTPTVYKINGSNYFKIRDLAAILNGTSKQFSVGYDGALKSVTATTGQGYTKQPGDLAGAPAGGNKIAEPSNDAIYINGEKIAAEVYKIDGNNYFKLRDLGAALDFYVGYSAETGVFLETDKPYAK